ncbi:MAG: 50S ribosomal protein L11 methyltransferase [Ignavibacteria bacterium]|nr:50S ribosomal protein L11 methyltransferase [Ignavibacteria bacterium]
MNKTYLELSFSLSQTQQELLIAFLSQLGFEGFWEDNDILKGYVEKNIWNENSSAFLSEKFPDVKFSVAEIENQDWNKEWENSIEPILATEKIIIRPSWKEIENTNGKIVITIDPKMSFGTGHHETTRLMLQLAEKYVQQNDFVLDLGTGTGILAIAAIKLGAKKCIAVDNDEWSIENTKENVTLNNVGQQISVQLGTLESVKENNFDAILANIQSSIILPILPQMISSIKPNGKILLSGLLRDERENILSAFAKNSLNVIEEVSENEWIAFVCNL